MNNAKLKKLLARQESLAQAIRDEKRQTKIRKQKALFSTVKRLGMLDLSDDDIEAALLQYGLAGTNNDQGEQP